MKKLRDISILFVFMYLLMAFYSWDINAGNWAESTRFVFCLFYLALCLFSFIKDDLNI